jgi:hypothetical protein
LLNAVLDVFWIVVETSDDNDVLESPGNVKLPISDHA